MKKIDFMFHNYSIRLSQLQKKSRFYAGIES